MIIISCHIISYQIAIYGVIDNVLLGGVEYTLQQSNAELFQLKSV